MCIWCGASIFAAICPYGTACSSIHTAHLPPSRPYVACVPMDQVERQMLSKPETDVEQGTRCLDEDRSPYYFQFPTNLPLCFAEVEF
jgi:hypothetical protein